LTNLISFSMPGSLVEEHQVALSKLLHVIMESAHGVNLH
jgi:hypothetical protein